MAHCKCNGTTKEGKKCKNFATEPKGKPLYCHCHVKNVKSKTQKGG
jgi:hypothetical protein